MELLVDGREGFERRRFVGEDELGFGVPQRKDRKRERESTGGRREKMEHGVAKFIPSPRARERPGCSPGIDGGGGDIEIGRAHV